MKIIKAHAVISFFGLLAAFPLPGAATGGAIQPFLEKNCVECHDADTEKGGLNLTTLKFDLANTTNFSKWVLVHDRVSDGEMPPKKKARPDAADDSRVRGCDQERRQPDARRKAAPDVWHLQ